MKELTAHSAAQGAAGKKARNGKVDFLKFIFSVIIVIHHGSNVVGKRETMFLSGGSFAVEFFFLVSGYLMMASIKKMQTAPTNLGLETRNFIVRKYKSFCPEIIVAFVISLIFYYNVEEVESFERLFIFSSYEGFLLGMTGLCVTSINSVVWYISSMLLCMAIMYPLIRKRPELTVKYILPLAAILMLGYFCGNETSPRGPTEWMGWTYRGNLRAFAELSIGVCSYEVVEKLKKVNFTKIGKWLLTVLEYSCYIQLIWYMYNRQATRADYFYILVFAVAVIITFSEQTVDGSLYNNKLCYFLGKFSFALYLSHIFYAKGINTVFPDLRNRVRMLIYLGCAFATAGVVMIVSDGIRKIWKPFTGMVKKILVKTEA